MPTDSNTPLEAAWCGFWIPPAVVLLCVLGALVALLAWIPAPFLLYWKKYRELRQDNDLPETAGHA
jgi:hypothetical protein